MRIAVITSSYPRYPGDGTAPFVKSICEHLVKLGHEVEVVAPYDPDVIPMHSNVMVHRFRYIWPKKFHKMGHARAMHNDARLNPLSYFLLPFFLISGFLKLMYITERQKSQVIHAHWVIPNGLIAAWVALLRRIPFVISLHGSDIFIAQRNPLFKAVTRWVFHRSAGVTACSPELQQSAIELGAPFNILLLAWGADPDIFRPNRRNSEYRKDKYGSDQSLIIGALGRLVAKKGFDKLIQAMPAILQNDPNAHLVLGGDGDLKDCLQEQVRKLGLSQSVQFLGALPWDEVPDFLANIDIFVLPSIRDKSGNIDGLPTVLLEAMSSGVAVIASDIGGVDMVIENGQNGIIVSSVEVGNLSKDILDLQIHKTERQKLGQAARQSVVDEYNWNKVARKISKLLESTITLRIVAPRLGTVYRHEMLLTLNQLVPSERVLDIGCHDGFLLSSVKDILRVGVDIRPIRGVSGVEFVCADALFLPFKNESFDQIYALDVIEHIEDDHSFADSLIRVLSSNGKIFLSTPSAKIRMFPPFLTKWISRKWGHFFRPGYSIEEINNLFEENTFVDTSYWSGFCYRFWYLPIRLFHTFFPHFSNRIVRKLAKCDALNTEGDNGFTLARITKMESNELPIKVNMNGN